GKSAAVRHAGKFLGNGRGAVELNRHALAHTPDGVVVVASSVEELYQINVQGLAAYFRQFAGSNEAPGANGLVLAPYGHSHGALVIAAQFEDSKAEPDLHGLKLKLEILEHLLAGQTLRFIQRADADGGPVRVAAPVLPITCPAGEVLAVEERHEAALGGRQLLDLELAHRKDCIQASVQGKMP